MATIDTSKLAAVNTMLAHIGESPVNSLENAVMPEVSMAVATLDEVSKHIQTQGWQWNTDQEVTLTRDANEQFPWQAHWIRFDVESSAYSSIDIVRRGGFLYDRKKATNVFTQTTLKGTLAVFLDWEDLPQTARHYIQIRGSRIFQDRVQGDESRHVYAKEDEQDALSSLQQEELEQGDYSILNSPDIRDVVSRLGGGGIL